MCFGKYVTIMIITLALEGKKKKKVLLKVVSCFRARKCKCGGKLCVSGRGRVGGKVSVRETKTEREREGE